ALDGVEDVVGVDLQPEHVAGFDLVLEVTAVFRALQFGDEAGPKLRRQCHPVLRIGAWLPGPDGKGRGNGREDRQPKGDFPKRDFPAAIFQGSVPNSARSTAMAAVYGFMPSAQYQTRKNSIFASPGTVRKFPRHKTKSFGGSFMSALPLSGIKILD